MSTKPSKNLQALMYLLDKQDEKDDAIKFNEELNDSAAMSRLSEQYQRMPTGIEHIVEASKRSIGKSLRVGLAGHIPMLSSVQSSKAEPEPEVKKPKEVLLEEGQMVIATGWDLGNRRAKRIWSGHVVQFKNNIVSIKLTNGKTVHLFNSDRYKWQVLKTRFFFAFSLRPKIDDEYVRSNR